MSTLPPDWYADPLGRYQQRFWDGSEWTARVRTGGVEQVDPLGVSTSIPFAIPATAYRTPDDTSGSRRRWLAVGAVLVIAAAVIATIAVLVA